MIKEGYPLKRYCDFTLALVGLFLSSPFWLIFSLAIWLEDGWPVFYCQERVGKDGEIFNNIKFRSMVKDAEKETGPVQAREDDSRVTRIGRFLRRSAMDELPQLINIARGQMSFVGPRPLRPEEIELPQDSREMPSDYPYNARLAVRPGLTGVAQVCAPRDIPISQKARYDLWYIENQALLLDIKLILQSFWITLNRKWDTSCRGFQGN